VCGHTRYALATFLSFSTARSPLYSHISSTIQGLSTIRSFKEETRFLDKLYYYVNEHTKGWYLYIVTNRWFSLRIDLISALFLTIVLMSAIPLADGKYFASMCTVILIHCGLD